MAFISLGILGRHTPLTLRPCCPQHEVTADCQVLLIVTSRGYFSVPCWLVVEQKDSNSELWLEPVNGPATERVVMGLSRGNTDDSEFGWRTLEVGVMGESQSSLEKRTQGTPWSNDFHTFELQWTPDQMQFSVDNQEIHQVSSDGFPIVNKEVYITLGVHVAGNKDFPDTIRGKPWKNSDPKPYMWKNYSLYIIESFDKMERFLRFWDAKNSWYPSWNQESALQVEHIKITAI